MVSSPTALGTANTSIGMSKSEDRSVTAGLHRRGFLKAGGLGFLGAAGDFRSAARAAGRGAGRGGRADACIIVLLTGGPSHLDMWDPKPDAPAEIRGPFGTIPTSVPGVRFTEHLPKLAKQLHRCALVRSVHHKVRGAHAAAVYTALTGISREDFGKPASRTDHPAFGSVLAKRRGVSKFPLPYAWLPFRTSEVELGGEPIPGMLGGFLGPRFDPFFALGDPSDPDFEVPALKTGTEVDAVRSSDRMRLLDALDRRESTRVHAEWREFRDRAREMMGSPTLRKAFSVVDEPDSIKDDYGQNQFGSSLLLARRLVEAGSRVVCVSAGSNLNNTWDTHFDNFETLKSKLLPKFDAGLSALVGDLADRGMLGRTLVMAFGEFGRTPRIGVGDAGGTGRSHWPDCYTVFLAGGGVKGGVAFGRSDKIGAFPADDPVTPADVLATAYRCLGVAPGPESDLIDPLGRPVGIAPGGMPIGQLIQ